MRSLFCLFLCLACLPLLAAVDPRIPEGVSKRLENNRAWLAANAEREGVKKYYSGVQVEILQEGYGQQPHNRDYVYVYYTGSLIDGTVFNKYDDPEKDPIRFQVNNTIPGFSEALQYLRVGTKARIVIPSDLGYGKKGTPGIPPYSILIFEVEMVDVERI